MSKVYILEHNNIDDGEKEIVGVYSSLKKAYAGMKKDFNEQFDPDEEMLECDCHNNENELWTVYRKEYYLSTDHEYGISVMELQ